MKTNSIWMMTAAMAAMLCGTALAQGNGNNQPTGQAGAGGATSVVVTNGSAQPVPVSTTQTLPVKEMNDIGHQPFAFRWNYSFVSGNPLMTVAAPGVPAGKRLVIDYVSGSASGITTGTEMVITIEIGRAHV